jgi:hypothetical protein
MTSVLLHAAFGLGAVVLLQLVPVAGANGDPSSGPRHPLPSANLHSGYIWAALGIGSGAGLHPSRKLEFREDVTLRAGFAPATLMHFEPEVGYQLSPWGAVSVQYRIQFVPQDGATEGGIDRRPRSAHALLLRVHRLLPRPGLGPAELWMNAAVGIGSAFRLRVPTSPDRPTSDTIDGGPIVVGPGAAVLLPLAENFAMGMAVRSLFGFWRVALLAELSIGAVHSF